MKWERRQAKRDSIKSHLRRAGGSLMRVYRDAVKKREQKRA